MWVVVSGVSAHARSPAPFITKFQKQPLHKTLLISFELYFLPPDSPTPTPGRYTSRCQNTRMALHPLSRLLPPPFRSFRFFLTPTIGGPRLFFFTDKIRRGQMHEQQAIQIASNPLPRIHMGSPWHGRDSSAAGPPVPGNPDVARASGVRRPLPRFT
jgi:hypothetical protein